MGRLHAFGWRRMLYIDILKRPDDTGCSSPSLLGMSNLNKRQLLGGALAVAAVGAASPAVAQQNRGAINFLQGILQDGAAFDPAQVREAARALATRPFAQAANTLPDPISTLTADQFAGIRHRPERLIWSDEASPVLLEPLHRGYVYATPTAVGVVENGLVRQIVYDPLRYDFGRVQPPANPGNLLFSGISLRLRDMPDSALITFQGGTFFRARGHGHSLGAMARAIAIKTGDPRGEEFPLFRAFWIERPASAEQVVIHAVADSESVTAAFRFVVRSGEMTVVDVEAELFARAAVDHLGLAAIQGMFLHAPNRRRTVDDIRPAVHEVNGLQVHNGSREWLWRPLNNPVTLQVSSFMDDNPRAFGLVQRERDFGNFLDDNQRFDLAPSVWIEPLGDWGPGVVQLTEIPNDSEVNDNIISYWRPAAPLAAGASLTFAYRQFWCWQPPEVPALARVTNFRIGRGSTARRRRVLAEFASNAFLKNEASEPALHLSASPGQALNPLIRIDHERGVVRVLFELEPQGEQPSELRLVLLNGDAPISETLLYRWTP
jgi:periplasmic glucans biosynthesis protein